MPKLLLTWLALIWLTLSAQAQVPTTGAGLGSPVPAGNIAITYGTFQTTVTSVANLFTFTNVNINIPNSTSYVVVGITYNQSGTSFKPTAVTIGATSAIHVSGIGEQIGGQLVGCDIWYAPYSTVGTPTVTVQMNGATARLTIYPYLITAPNPTYSVAKGNNTSSGKTISSGSMSVPAGGGTIGVGLFASAGTPTAASGMAVTDESSGSDAGPNWHYVGNDTTNTGTQTFTLTWTASTNSAACGMFASFFK